jgi:hypothetical protein
MLCCLIDMEFRERERRRERREVDVTLGSGNEEGWVVWSLGI